MNRKQKKIFTRIILAAVMVVALNFLSVQGLRQLALYLAAYLIIGYDILKKAGKGIWNHQVFDENFLMVVATVGAFALAIYTRSGDYTEAIAVMLFYQIGELFQSYAVGKSRRNISALMDIRPDYANIERNGVLVQVNPDEVAVGSIIAVQPGEKVPLDGEVTEGRSTLNTSALTGESIPREAQAGDEVFSGCINMTGVLKIRTTKNSVSPLSPRSWILWRTPAPANPSQRPLSPNLPGSTPPLSAMRLWLWPCFRHWYRCCFWGWRLRGALGFIGH